MCKVELFFTEREKQIIQSALGLLFELRADPQYPIAGIQDIEIHNILKKIPVEED
jgi:hypothetical protein